MAQNKASLQKRLTEFRAAIVHPLPSWTPSQGEILDLLADLDEYMSETLAPEDLASELDGIAKEIDTAFMILSDSVRLSEQLRTRINGRTTTPSPFELSVDVLAIRDRTDRAKDHVGNASAKLAVIDF